MIRTQRSGKCVKHTNNKNGSPADFHLESRENLILNESRHAGVPGEMPRATTRCKRRGML
jgi:hypothetical protein